MFSGYITKHFKSIQKYATNNSNKYTNLKTQKTLYDYYQLQLGSPIDLNQQCLQHTPIQLIEQNYKIQQLENKWLNEIENKTLMTYDTNSPIEINTKLPKNSKEFVEWLNNAVIEYKKIEGNIFKYIENEADIKQLAIYICMEDLVDSKFDDLIAISQIGIKNMASKMALANNYWDEMGNGDLSEIHGLMFENCSQWFKNNILTSNQFELTNYNWECLQNTNLLLCYALRRYYSVRLLGAITILEETAYDRFDMLVKSMDRLNIPKNVSKYQRLHAKLDQEHGKELIEDVCIPLIDDSIKQNYQIGQNFIKQLCIGILTRIIVAKDYYNGVQFALDNVNVTEKEYLELLKSC